MSTFNGHILGKRKLRALNARLGTDFDKASRVSTKYGIARQIIDGKCIHFEFEWDTGVTWLEDNPIHWATCPKETK